MGGQGNDPKAEESALSDPRMRRAFLELRRRLRGAPALLRRDIEKILRSMEEGSTPEREELARVLVWAMDMEFRRKEDAKRARKVQREDRGEVKRPKKVARTPPVKVDTKQPPVNKESGRRGGFTMTEEEAPRAKMVRQSLGVPRSRAHVESDESGRRKTVIRGDRREG
jgi:hypothetical protein